MVCKIKDRRLYRWDSENRRIGDPDTKYTQSRKPGPKGRYPNKINVQVTEAMSNEIEELAEDLMTTPSDVVRRALAEGLKCLN